MLLMTANKMILFMVILKLALAIPNHQVSVNQNVEENVGDVGDNKERPKEVDELSNQLKLAEDKNMTHLEVISVTEQQQLEHLTSMVTEKEESIRQQNEVFLNARSKLKCKRKLVCKLQSGKCISKEEKCIGTVVPGGCRGGRCQCCAPRCPEDQNTFLFPATNQCFRFYYKEPLKNWFAAVQKCNDSGLILAKPFNAVDLRSYMIQRFNAVYNEPWLNARGDGTSFKWQNDLEPLPNDSPLWYQERKPQPSSVGTDACLILLVMSERWGQDREAPYYVGGCSNWGGKFALCEFVYA